MRNEVHVHTKYIYFLSSLEFFLKVLLKLEINWTAVVTATKSLWTFIIVLYFKKKLKLEIKKGRLKNKIRPKLQSSTLLLSYYRSILTVQPDGIWGADNITARNDVKLLHLSPVVVGRGNEDSVTCKIIVTTYWYWLLMII